ncbi:cilia- and flagella-associated protein 73 [Boleophthalmus pectinirostris]|uniref:cilia- and flagella-associated protein 73 n=1 Tax=Boleophthalmus pectinirostris TaxID=150288 RepID=UPI002431C588|nr:cilia- and flagella-associated protein 73 [Boleophthalmus pectinirostris]
MMKKMEELIQERSPKEELALLRYKNEELLEQLRNKTQCLESLRKEQKLLTKKIQEAKEESEGYGALLQTKSVAIEEEKEKKQWEIVEAKRAVVRKQEEQISQLKEKRDQKLKLVDEMAVYYNFMERVAKMTMFNDVQEFINYLENLFYTWEKQHEAESIKLEEINTKQNELQSLENHLYMASHHNSFLLSTLHKELEKCRSEADIWEENWGKIQKTAAKKILLLAQIKIAIVNLYEMTGGVVGEDGINVSDTEKHLDKIVSFIQDNEDIVKLFRISLQKEKENIKSRSRKNRKTN